MKKTITIWDEQPQERDEAGLVTHRLKPKRKDDTDSKSVSIGDRTGVSTNELLSSISPKLYPRSISLSSENRQSTLIFDKEEVRISCLDTLSIPKFSLAYESNSLEFEELKRAAIRKKIKNIVIVPNCIHKVKKICTEPNCSVKQRWKTKLVLEQRDLLQAETLKKIIGQNKLKYDKQIEKDVLRSFATNIVPKTKITLYHATSDKNNIFQMLRTVLKMVSHSDPDVGYVQGMNLYMAVVVSHVKEIGYSFVFVRQIMKYGNMRNMYVNGFEKLKQVAEHLLHRHVKIMMNDLYEVLMEAGVSSEIFMPFYLSMFACVIDYSLMPSIIDQFMAKGFLFLDKLMLSMLCFLKDQILFTDPAEAACKLGASFIRSHITGWQEVINLAQVIDLN